VWVSIITRPPDSVPLIVPLQAAQAGCTAGGRKADAAEMGPHSETKRIAGCAARQFDVRVDPFAGGSNLLQPLARSRLAAKAGDAARVGAQIARPRADSSNPPSPSRQAAVELRIRVAVSVAKCTYATPRQRPAIAGMGDGERARTLGRI